MMLAIGALLLRKAFNSFSTVDFFLFLHIFSFFFVYFLFLLDVSYECPPRVKIGC
jgi:hypothetical protein